MSAMAGRIRLISRVNMLARQSLAWSTPTIQHYKSYPFGFAGVIIDPRLEGDNEEAPVNAEVLRDLLIEVLEHRPHLQGQLLTASAWRSHILAATRALLLLL